MRSLATSTLHFIYSDMSLLFNLNISFQYYVELLVIQCRTYQVVKYCAVLRLTTRLNKFFVYANYLCFKHKAHYLAYSYGQEIKRKKISKVSKDIPVTGHGGP
jgi:hypothetical protein